MCIATQIVLTVCKNTAKRRLLPTYLHVCYGGSDLFSRLGMLQFAIVYKFGTAIVTSTNLVARPSLPFVLFVAKNIWASINCSRTKVILAHIFFDQTARIPPRISDIVANFLESVLSKILLQALANLDTIVLASEVYCYQSSSP